jgi:hypothetical protein
MNCLIGKIFNIGIGGSDSADAIVTAIEVDESQEGTLGDQAKLQLVDFGAPIMSEYVDSLLSKNEVIRKDINKEDYDLSKGVYSSNERLANFAKKMDVEDFKGSLI